MEVVFILRICKIWFGHLSLSLTFEYDPVRFSARLKFQDRAKCGNIMHNLSLFVSCAKNNCHAFNVFVTAVNSNPKQIRQCEKHK